MCFAFQRCLVDLKFLTKDLLLMALLGGTILIARLPSAQAHGVNTLQSALFTESFKTYAGKTNGIILRNKPKEVSPNHV